MKIKNIEIDSEKLLKVVRVGLAIAIIGEGSRLAMKYFNGPTTPNDKTNETSTSDVVKTSSDKENNNKSVLNVKPTFEYNGVIYSGPYGYDFEVINGHVYAVREKVYKSEVTKSTNAQGYVVYTAPEGYVLVGNHAEKKVTSREPARVVGYVNEDDEEKEKNKKVTTMEKDGVKYMAPDGFYLVEINGEVVAMHEETDVSEVSTSKDENGNVIYTAPAGYVMVGDMAVKTSTYIADPIIVETSKVLTK